MAGLIDLVRDREISADSNVLYAHLGGQPALNAYSALFPRPRDGSTHERAGGPLRPGCARGRSLPRDRRRPARRGYVVARGRLGGVRPSPPRRSDRGRRGGRRAAGGRRGTPRGIGGAALLRICDGRLDSGRDRCRPVGGRLGPEHLQPTHVAGRRGRRGAAGRYLRDLLGLPATASFGFVTGGQGANTVGLAAARHHVLAKPAGTSRTDGLVGAPRMRVVASEERHATIDRSLRLLGLGTAALGAGRGRRQGATDIDALTACSTTGDGPTIVCLQAGNVNTGACDDIAPRDRRGPPARRLGARRRRVRAVGGGEPIDAPSRRRHRAGRLVGHRRAQVAQRAVRLRVTCSARIPSRTSLRCRSPRPTSSGTAGRVRATARDYVPESSRRARGFATWAALRELGRRRCGRARRSLLRCLRAASPSDSPIRRRRHRQRRGAQPGAGRLRRRDAHDRRDRAAVQRDGTCWMGGTTWHGRRLMRISVSNWTTTEADVDRSAAAIVAAAGSVG